MSIIFILKQVEQKPQEENLILHSRELLYHFIISLCQECVRDKQRPNMQRPCPLRLPMGKQQTNNPEKGKKTKYMKYQKHAALLNKE